MQNQNRNTESVSQTELRPLSFDELLKEYEKGRSATEFKPIFTAEEPVSVVVIYDPEQEQEPLASLQEKPEPKPKKQKSPKEKRSRCFRFTLPRLRRGSTGALLLSAFVLLVLAFWVLFPISSQKGYSEAEKRSLARLPSISAVSLKNGSFMTRFESYLCDHFPMRDNMVRARTYVKRLMGSSEENGVYIGRNGRLFEQQTPYDKKKVQKTVKAVNRFSALCGIKNQLMILVPNASCILEEDLPLFVKTEDQQQHIKKIYKGLNDSIVPFNACGVLKKAENLQSLYYKTDHHWTTEAAEIVFRSLAKKWKLGLGKVRYDRYVLSTDFYGTLSSSAGIYDSPDTIYAVLPHNSTGTYTVKNADLQKKTASLFDLTKLETTNPYEVFFGGNFSRLVINTTNRNDKALLVFKDSYANCLIPMLTPFFQKIVVIDPRYFQGEIGAVLSDEAFTHLLFLYNVNTFLEDSCLHQVLNSLK